MSRVGKTNAHQKDKYKSHPTQLAANKKRKLNKHLKNHPNDLQAEKAL